MIQILHSFAPVHNATLFTSVHGFYRVFTDFYNVFTVFAIFIQYVYTFTYLHMRIIFTVANMCTNLEIVIQMF